MKTKLFQYLKILACLAFFLSFYPFVSLFNGLLSNAYSNVDCILQQIFIMICGALGCIFSMLFQNVKVKHAVRINLIFMLTCIIPGGAAIALFLNKGVSLSVLIAILAVVSYACGSKIYYLNYSKVMTGNFFMVQIGINVVVIFILWISKSPYNLELIIGNFMLILLLFGMIRNQSNIDFLMERRNHKFENLPKNIRFYNMKLSLFLLAAIVLCFFLRDWLIAAIYWIGGAVLTIFKAILYALYWLINLVPTISQEKSNDKIPKVSSAGSQADIFTAILLIAGIAVLILLLIKKRHQIIRFFVALFQKIAEKIRRILQQSNILIKPKAENEYYFDKEEFISPKEIEKEISQKKRLKGWSKSCKKFYKMADSSEKVRFGCKLVIDGLKLSGIQIPPSDTTIEILDKSRDIIKTESYTLVTEDYNSIRYGNLQLKTETIKNLTEAIQTVSDSFGKK